MTLPHERLRSLLWGEELIHALQLDAEIPTGLAQRAAELEHSYPAKSVLESLIATQAPALPTEHAEALDSAQKLFHETHQAGVGNEATRRHVLFTLRHFPEARELFQRSKTFPGQDISDWIQPDS